MTKKNSILKYLIYFLILFVPIAIFRDFTPDNELRYISISNEMIQNGYHFILKTHGNIYTDKPPLYIWIITFTKYILGTYKAFAIALFSIIPSFFIVLTMNKWTKEKLNEEEQEISSLMLITTAIFMASTVTLRMDMLMSLFIVLSIFFFYRIYKKKNKKYEVYLLYFSIFMALFTKGPMGLISPLLPIIIFLFIKKDKETLKNLNLKIGSLILLGLTAFWFLMVFREGGREYLNQLVFKQTINRSIKSFAHARPFYYYLKNIFYTFAPWILIYLFGIVDSIRNFKKISDLEKLFLITILSTFIFLSFVSGKLDIYLLPIYAFCPYLSLMRLKEKANAKKLFFLLSTIFIALLAVIQLVIPFIMKDKFNLNTYSYIFLILAFINFVLSIFKLKKGTIYTGIKFTFIGMVFFINFFTLNISVINEQIGLKKVAELIKNETNYKEYKIYSFDEEDFLNIDVLIDKKIKLIKGEEDLISALNSSNKSYIIIKTKDYERYNNLFITNKEVLINNSKFTLIKF